MLIILFRNDGTGDSEIGNYEVEVRVNQFELHRQRIEGHRRADGWRELVRMLVRSEESGSSPFQAGAVYGDVPAEESGITGGGGG